VCISRRMHALATLAEEMIVKELCEVHCKYMWLRLCAGCCTRWLNDEQIHAGPHQTGTQAPLAPLASCAMDPNPAQLK